MSNGSVSQAPQFPKQVYGVFVGGIDQASLQRIFNTMTIAINNKVEKVHVLFQTTGGIIGDGICLYNFLRTAPIEVVLYNVGSIASVGVIAYLGAKTRRATENSTFMIHRCYANPQNATSERLQAAAQSLVMDDERTEAVLRAHLKLSDEKWAAHKLADIWLSAKDSKTAGLVTEIADFAPPLGDSVFNI